MKKTLIALGLCSLAVSTFAQRTVKPVLHGHIGWR